MKTILIKPNTKQEMYGELEKYTAIEPPLWLTLMANCYEDPMIIDAEAENLYDDEVVELVDNIKNIEEIIFLPCGNHPSAFVQQKDACYSLMKKQRLDVPSKCLEYLNYDPTKAGVPNWDLLPMNRYRAHNWHCWGDIERDNYGTIFTSISCPYSCSFCTVKNFYNSKYKRRELTDIMQDIKTQYFKFGVRNFKMMDELFVFPNDHTKLICKEFENELGNDLNIWAYARINTVNAELLKTLRKAGIRWLSYGIESGNYNIRESMNKGAFTNSQIKDVIKMTKDSDIKIIGNFMFGFWNDSQHTLNETLKLAFELQCEYSNFYCLTAYPKTEVYEDMRKDGVDLPIKSEEFAQMSYNFKPLPTANLTAREVLEFRDRAFTSYFRNSEYLNMIRKTFGENTVKEVEEMTSVEIKRKALEND